MENGVNFFGNKNNAHWPLCCRIQILLYFDDYVLPSAIFDVGSLLRNICSSQIRIFFLNFDHDQDFPGHLLQVVDGQLQCDDFRENLMKIG